MTSTLQQIQERAYATAKSKGWHDKPLTRLWAVGAAYGDTRFGAPVHVVESGEHRGMYCLAQASGVSVIAVHGKLFGAAVQGGDNRRAVELREVMHDRVLRMHALMHTELTEAHDEIANGSNELYFGEGGKPEGLPAEVADFIIRVCDTTAALGLVLDERGDKTWWAKAKGTRPAWEIHRESGRQAQRIAATLWLVKVRVFVDLATEAARVDAWEAYTENLTLAVLYAASIVAGYGHDLPAAIEAKMSYNETRTHRHGGKQA